jgi:hypothetical protein
MAAVHDALGILAVVGLETFVGTAPTLGNARRLSVLAGGTALSVVAFGIGAPAAQMQTWLLLSVAIGICAALGAELVAGDRRVERTMLLVLLATLLCQSV